MQNKFGRVFLALLFVLIALVSMLVVAPKMSSVEYHEATISSIDAKVDTVLALTASSTVASAAMSALPGDMATPIAEKLADFSEYFLFILCVLYAEKYLVTIIGAAAFKILIPAGCVCGIIGIFYNPKGMGRMRIKLFVLALALFFTIPLSITVSDMIFAAYQESIDSTINETEKFTEDANELNGETESGSLISNAIAVISGSAGSMAERAADILNDFIETLAVIIVTSCVIPLLVLLFFLWIIKQVTGLDIPVYIGRRKRRADRAVKAAGKAI